MVLYLVLCFIGNPFKHFEVYLAIGFLMTGFYFATNNMILYVKLSKKYNLELRATRMSEPSMKYSTLNNDVVGDDTASVISYQITEKT